MTDHVAANLRLEWETRTAVVNALGSGVGFRRKPAQFSFRHSKLREATSQTDGNPGN